MPRWRLPHLSECNREEGNLEDILTGTILKKLEMFSDSAEVDYSSFSRLIKVQ